MRISFFSRFVYSILLIIITSGFFLNNVKNKMADTYTLLISSQTKKIVTRLVNEIVRNNINENDVEIIYDKEKYVSYDVSKINKTIYNLSNEIINALKNINNAKYDYLVDSVINRKYHTNGLIIELEMGKLFNNVFISSLGSKYPIKFSLASDVFSNVDLSINEFGINNAIVSLNMLLSFDFNVVLPMNTKLDSIELKVPLNMILIEGKVPTLLSEVTG